MVQQRAEGGFLVDSGALALLEPPPPDRNSSAAVADVLRLAQRTPPEHIRDAAAGWRRLFANLNLPNALDVSAWPSADFSRRANEVLMMYQLLASNATQAEADAFADGPARDALELQRQGEALAALQRRALQALAIYDCNSGPQLPDINGNKPSGGLSLPVLICASIVALTTVTGCVLCFCRRCRRIQQKRRAQLALEAASVLLGSGAECSPSALAVQPEPARVSKSVEPSPEEAQMPPDGGSVLRFG